MDEAQPVRVTLDTAVGDILNEFSKHPDEYFGPVQRAHLRLRKCVGDSTIVDDLLPNMYTFTAVDHGKLFNLSTHKGS